jgi:signal recognition particle GTPase
MEFNEILLYDKTKFSDILKEIHTNHKTKEQELRQLIKDLKVHITNAGDAVIVVPLLTKYIEAQIKNDDTLVKMIGIVQRAMAKSNGDSSNDFGLSASEKQSLYDEAMKIA